MRKKGSKVYVLVSCQKDKYGASFYCDGVYRSKNRAWKEMKRQYKKQMKEVGAKGADNIQKKNHKIWENKAEIYVDTLPEEFYQWEIYERAVII